MVDVHKLICQTCNNVGVGDGSDGFFYCLRCGSQCEDVMDTAVDDDDLFNKSAVYLPSHQRQRSVAIKAEPISQYDSFYDSHSNFIRNLGLEDENPQRNDHVQVKREEEFDAAQFDEASPSVPADFGGSQVACFEDYHNEIRMRYVMGLQMMIELQCEALVKEFKVTPLICGLVGPIWLRFVSKTGIFGDDWADKVIHDSETQNEDEPEDYKLRAKYRTEPHNMFAIRILYNINGFGEWEKSLSRDDDAKDNSEMGNAFASDNGHDFGKESKDSAEDQVGSQKHELDSAWLLQHLQARYNEIADTYGYSKDLATYLKYCRDVVFAGSEPSYGNHEEEKMIEYLWKFYQNEEDTKPSENVEQSNTSFNQTSSRDKGCIGKISKEEKIRKKGFNELFPDDDTSLEDVSNNNSHESLSDSEDSDSQEHSSGKSHVKEAIRQMKLEMEENRFYYIPPSVKRKRLDYIHYVRKRDEGLPLADAPKKISGVQKRYWRYLPNVVKALESSTNLTSAVNSDFGFLGHGHYPIHAFSIWLSCFRPWYHFLVDHVIFLTHSYKELNSVSFF